jgi:hypothetical protein
VIVSLVDGAAGVPGSGSDEALPQPGSTIAASRRRASGRMGRNRRQLGLRAWL